MVDRRSAAITGSLPEGHEVGRRDEGHERGAYRVREGARKKWREFDVRIAIARPCDERSCARLSCAVLSAMGESGLRPELVKRSRGGEARGGDNADVRIRECGFAHQAWKEQYV